MSVTANPEVSAGQPSASAPPSVPEAVQNTVVLKITKMQVEGILSRQDALERAQETLKFAQLELNNFLSGVVTGHGYASVQTQSVDDVKCTLTVLTSPQPMSDG